MTSMEVTSRKLDEFLEEQVQVWFKFPPHVWLKQGDLQQREFSTSLSFH